MGFLEIRDTSNVPTIPEYYKGKSIFITGGSGLMGQALVEKLLYSCPELDSVYLLMRKKKGVLPEDRREKLYSSHCFNRLRKEKPTIFHEKVHVVAGDVTELGLGLSDEDRTLLINRVNIIFHAAASVRFDDPLPYAVKLNLRGTRELVNLAKEIRKLSVFVHVSTCYSNVKYSVVEETMYPPLADWRECMEICDKIDENTIKTLTPKYLNGMPNTYVFTKQLAEHLVLEEKGKLPIVIIRPSVVTASIAEPAPGWNCNFNGPCALFVACGKGIKHCLYGEIDAKNDFIPLDICIKHFVVAAWTRGTTEFKSTDDVPIYNCSANKCLSLEELVSQGVMYGQKYPPENSLWALKKPIVTNNFSYYYVCAWLFHLLPAMLIDFILWISGGKPMLFKLQKKIYIADLALYYFMSRSWSFPNTNFLKLCNTIKSEDRDAFNYETFEINDEYFENTLIGGKIYLLNEKIENIEKARAHQKRLVILDKAVKVMFSALLLWWFINTKYIKNVYQILTEY